MKRASAGSLAFVLLLVAVLAVSGCTKEKPGGRAPDSAALVGVASVTPVLTVPGEPSVGDTLPTLTPTPTLRATTVAVPPTPTSPAAAASDTGFEELIAQPTPTPAPTVAAPGGGLPEDAPPATAVPILTPYPEPGNVGPVPLASPTPMAAVPTPALAAPQGTVYVVRWGDTLSSIAEQFGVTADAIRSANGIVGDNIVVGQQLIIPVSPPAPTPGSGAPSTVIVHIVQPGENLFRIALLYGTTVEAITQANGISNPWFIYVGQQLNIPVTPGGAVSPAPGGRTYVVQPGDTLYMIAVRFNTTVEALMVANNLSNANLLHVGQVLVLP
jgi:LysM repeat protein